MKNQKLHLVITSVFLFAVFGFGPAYAQGPLAPIKSDFCIAVAEISLDAASELGEATKDAADCLVEFEDCRSGRFGRDPTNCINEYARCNNFANRDQEQACDRFSEEFLDLYNDTLRESSFLNLEFRFMRWANSNARARECLEPAVSMYEACAGLTD